MLIRSSATFFLYSPAPQATGSKTAGTLYFSAIFRAAWYNFQFSSVNVPMFINKPPAYFNKSSKSAGNSLMAGEAPSATNPFAVKFFTTSLVIQMTNGAFSFNNFKLVILKSFLFTLYDLLISIYL
ncbi:Uncharacterised protein [Streptococcus pneumoniae]|nr:Uncharacterised protein [Streptococcus pneumoniae]